jgi:hypothetical protein
VTTSTYSIQAVDYDQNVSTSTSFSVTTPQITSVMIATPPARVGLRPTGAY